MIKYKITLRRENAEVGISITELATGKLIYKNGFFASVDYYEKEEFEELSDKFLEYVNESIIQFRNLDRYYNLLRRLMKNKMIAFSRIDVDEEHNIVTITGGLD